MRSYSYNGTISNVFVADTEVITDEGRRHYEVKRPGSGPDTVGFESHNGCQLKAISFTNGSSMILLYSASTVRLSVCFCIRSVDITVQPGKLLVLLQLYHI